MVPFAGDISDQDSVEKAIDLAVKEFGRLDVPVNNAGIMDDMSPIGDVKNEKIDNVFLEQGNGGNIINVASLGAMRTVAGAVYNASKAAMISLTKNTALKILEAAPEPGTSEQIASVALFLASEDSSYVNGDVLVMDGGWNAG